MATLSILFTRLLLAATIATSLPREEPHCPFHPIDQKCESTYTVEPTPIAKRHVGTEVAGVLREGCTVTNYCGKSTYTIGPRKTTADVGYFNAPYGIDVGPFLPPGYTTTKDGLLQRDGKTEIPVSLDESRVIDIPKCSRADFKLGSLYDKVELDFIVTRHCHDCGTGTEVVTGRFIATASYLTLLDPFFVSGTEFEALDPGQPCECPPDTP